MSEISIYTDASWMPRCHYGIYAFVVLTHPVQYVAGTIPSIRKGFPDTAYAECYAVQQALLFAQNYKTIHIHYDCTAIADALDLPLSSLSHPPLRRLKQWKLAHPQLNIVLHKVPAHKQNAFNNVADRLARCAYRTSELMRWNNFRWSDTHEPDVFLHPPGCIPTTARIASF